MILSYENKRLSLHSGTDRLTSAFFTQRADYVLVLFQVKYQISLANMNFPSLMWHNYSLCNFWSQQFALCLNVRVFWFQLFSTCWHLHASEDCSSPTSHYITLLYSSTTSSEAVRLPSNLLAVRCSAVVFLLANSENSSSCCFCADAHSAKEE